MCECVCVCVCGLSLITMMEIAVNNWINSLKTTSSLDIRVAPATRTRGKGGRRPPSPLVLIKGINDEVLLGKCYCCHVCWLLVAYMVRKGT